MLKRLCVCFVLCILPQNAFASANLAKLWGSSASELRLETADLLQAVHRGVQASVSDRYALDVYRFGRTSAELAAWIDTTDGPQDLGCIFRGMSAEAEAQLIALEAAENGAAQNVALTRLTSLFADAEMIASAAQKRAPAPRLGAAPKAASCSADSTAVLDMLR